MFIKVNSQLGLILFPRAATSSVTNMLDPGSWSEVDRVHNLPDIRVAFMREPHARAASAWRLYSTDPKSPFKVTCFDDFIEDICHDNQGNPHVMTQWRLGLGEATHIIRWDFGALSRLLNRAIRHDNASVEIAADPVWDHRSLEWFNEVYQDDIREWELK